MHKLRKLFPLAGALLALALVSCGSDSDDGSEAVTPQKTAGSISYATTTVSKTTADAAFTNELTKTGDGTVSYASSKETVATVNATTGEVTIVGAGESTITATVADSDTYTYATKTATYTITVTEAVTAQKTAGSISYATTTVSKTTADAAFTNELTKTGDGTVTYASSKTDVATVNATTGEVTIVGTGETTITATVTDSDSYTYETKTASYTLTVLSPVTSISLNLTNVTLLPILGGASTETLVVSFLPENATENLTYSWESENSDIATVDDNGMVTGVSGGMTTITVKATGVNGELTATCTVIVNGIATPGRGATNYLTVSGASEANPVYFSGVYTGSANSESIPYRHGTAGSYDELYFNETQIYRGDWNVGSALIITGGTGTQGDPYVLSRI